MSNTNNPKAKTRRPVFFVLPGLLLLAACGFLVRDRLQVHTFIAPTPKKYSYNTVQTIENNVHYSQSSFYGSTPGPINSAYIADITDYINSQLHYSFAASKSLDVTYSYTVTALVQSTYGNQTSDGGVSNIWTKQYALAKPVSGTRTTRSLTFDPKVKIPFADYKAMVEQFKKAFSLSSNSQVVITFNARVSGKAYDTPFDDTKISTVTIPLDQPVYKPAVKFIKSEQHQVISKQSLRLEDIIGQYELAVAVVLGVMGLACIVYGLRKQIIKSPYQRELDKIYRYHDGIIIKATRPTNLAGKNVVTVQSFDDLLNIEEELKTPIIASKVSDTTTHFLVTRDDIIYVYTLGERIPFKVPTAVIAPPTNKPIQPVKPRVMG